MTNGFSVWGGLLIVALSFGQAAGNEPVAPAEVQLEEIKVGQPLPLLQGVDDAGQPWTSADHIGKVLVLYCYPGDFTGGCNRQAQAFREGLKRLDELGVVVVGISGDSASTHKLFKESHELTHTLLADPEGALARPLGIPVQRPHKPAKVRTRDLKNQPLLDEQGKSVFIERNVTLPRWTFVIGRDGKLASKRTKIEPATDAEEVIKIVETLTPRAPIGN